MRFEFDEPRNQRETFRLPDPVEYIENYIEGAKKIEKLLKHEKKGDFEKSKRYSGADVTSLSLLLLFLSPWTGLLVIRMMSYLAAQYADAFSNFAK